MYVYNEIVYVCIVDGCLSFGFLGFVGGCVVWIDVNYVEGV